MTIFVGLGNHETKYHNTKHNVGYWVLDSFAKRYGLEFKPGKGNYFVAKKGSSFMLIKPTTGMNNSGAIINEVLNFYKAKKEDLVIIFDDVDLPLGEIRLRADGGDEPTIRSLIPNAQHRHTQPECFPSCDACDNGATALTTSPCADPPCKRSKQAVASDPSPGIPLISF